MIKSLLYRSTRTICYKLSNGEEHFVYKRRLLSYCTKQVQTNQTLVVHSNTPLPCPVLFILRKHFLHTNRVRSGCRNLSSGSNSTSNNFTYNSNDQLLLRNDNMYCIQLVKERDYENGYICGLLLPQAAQGAYFAVRAFNVEIASIKDTSSKVRYNTQNSEDAADDNNPFEARTTAPPSILALQLRIQWWRNAIDVIYENVDNNVASDTSTTPVSAPPKKFTLSQQTSNPLLELSSLSTNHDHYWKNPVVRSLHRAIQSKQLKKRLLECIIDVRESDLYVDQYETIQECCNYADETISNLLLLSLECCSSSSNNVTNDTNVVGNENIDDIVTAAGIGIGLTTLLRATPYRLLLASSKSNDIPLPSELFRPNYPYYNIVSTFVTHNNNHNDENEISTTSGPTIEETLDPKIQLKLQRHIQSELLSEDDRIMFINAIRTMSDLSMKHFSYCMRELSSKERNLSHVQKMCFLSIIPNMNYISILRNRYQYDIFHTVSSTRQNQTGGRNSKFNIAKDRLSLFYKLIRTWVTGVY